MAVGLSPGWLLVPLLGGLLSISVSLSIRIRISISSIRTTTTTTTTTIIIIIIIIIICIIWSLSWVAGGLFLLGGRLNYSHSPN